MESGLRPEGKKGESETAASRFFLKLRELAAALSHHHAPGLAQTATPDAPSPAERGHDYMIDMIHARWPARQR